VSADKELELQEGWVGPELAEEFPELGLRYARVEQAPRRTPHLIRQRLRALSDRYTGGRVVHMRQDAVPWAYRVFFRQIGIDPDIHRTPAEGVALERLMHGGFRSRNLVDDALTIAVAETGVPVVALDGDRVGEAVGLRLAEPGETLAHSGRPLSAAQIVIADERRSLALLFGDVAEECGVTPDSKRMVIVAVRVKGVPEISIEEALWTALETLETPLERGG
jgi:DNA/RNA-binding domain of Phe-tRNA-synthetase-like protein